MQCSQKRAADIMEFMPVVLAAGMGSRIKHLSAHYPKALLTMGNYPMVYYPLAMLERHGFTGMCTALLVDLYVYLCT